MLKTLLFSIKKSRLLSKIASEHESSNTDFVIKWGVNNKSTIGQSLKDQYTEQLFSLLSKDKFTTQVLTSTKGISMI